MTVALRSAAFDGKPPAFLLRGLRLTAAGGPVIVAERQRLQEPQDGQVASAGPDMPPESETPVPDLAALAAMRSEVEALAGRLELAKDGIGAGGLALATQLRRLRQRHNLHASPLPLPLAPPCDAKLIRIRGYASTCDTDLDRSRFLPTCWSKFDASKIRLLMFHDETKVAGTLDSIEVDSLGRVVIVATVTNSLAMRLPALSISAAIDKFTIRDPDRSDFVGEIERVTHVNEISLTSTPSNRQCLVFERTVPTAVDLSFQEMIDRVKRMREMVLELAA